jgi:hypothetical protein
MIPAPVRSAGVVIVGDIESAPGAGVLEGGGLGADCIAFASPKSSTFTVPSGRI